MKKVLLIESDPVSRKLAAEILRKEDFQVLEAVDGQRGLKEIRENADLGAVVLSADLPGLSGMDTLLGIRKFKAGVPVIFVVDRNTGDQKMLAVRRGATDIITKPLKADDILLAVSRAATTSRLSSRIDRQIRRLQQLEKSALELTSMNLEDLAPEEVIRDDAFLKKTIDLMGEVLEVKKISLMMVDEAKQELVMAHSNWMTPAQMASIRQPLSVGVAGWVAKEGKPILIKDVTTDPRFAKAARRAQYESASFICTPLFFKRKVVGTISANDRTDGEAFSESDLSVLNTFAHQISMAIANLSTFRKLQREHHKLAAVNGAVNAILSAISPDEIFSDLAAKVRKLMDVDAVAIFSLSEENELLLEACAGPQPLKKEQAKRLAEGALANVLEGEPLLAPQAAKTKGVDPARDFPPGVEAKGLAAVPLKVRGKALGVMAIYNHGDDEPLSAHDLDVLEAIAPQVSMAIKNAWLYQNLLKSIDEVVAANSRLEAAREELDEKAREITALKKRIGK